jgi:hypothetical protein
MTPSPEALASMTMLDLLRSIENMQFLVQKQANFISVVREYIENPAKLDTLRASMAESIKELQMRTDEYKRRVS